MSYFRPYKYIKPAPKNSVTSLVNKRFALTFASPVILSSLGIFIAITQIVIPVVSFKTQDEIARPISSSVLGVATGFGEFEFSELEGSDSKNTKSLTNVPKQYYLTIPKLGIERALVDSMPEDLDPSDALGHYVGSQYPGEAGNSFIYGHSVLPAFFNPKNYKTIFSTLHLLDIGDEFTIEYNNKKFTYAVESKVILKPEEIDPLKGFKPKYLNEQTVTLMTCSPPGTKLKRLMVNAVLID